MNRKALVLALFTAVLGVVVLVLYKRRYQEQSAGGGPVAVLMAVQDIPLGSLVTERMLATRTIRDAYVESRHIRAGDLGRIVGVRVSMEVKAGESILWSDLATSTDERRDLSSLVKSGMRAITIPTDATSTFGGLLRPGDRVDAFLSLGPGNDRAARATVPLLQNALVLAVGRDTGETPDGPERGARSDSQVTLGITLTQAQEVALAVDRGRLTLALRNPDDTAILTVGGRTSLATVLPAERAP